MGRNCEEEACTSEACGAAKSEMAVEAEYATYKFRHLTSWEDYHIHATLDHIDTIKSGEMRWGKREREIER